jgi:hypothetical protein
VETETEQPALTGMAEAEPPPFATLVTMDGTLVRLRLTRFGDMSLQVGERQAKTLDRFQVAAMRVALLATADR